MSDRHVRSRAHRSRQSRRWLSPPTPLRSPSLTSPLASRLRLDNLLAALRCQTGRWLDRRFGAQLASSHKKEVIQLRFPHSAEVCPPSVH